jgi:hypothetical protein
VRFVFAILAFVVAAAMIVLGIAQHTIFLGPSTYAIDTTVKGDLPYTVISGEELTAQPGQQSLTVSGSDEVFLAYGRTADVLAWLGESPYNALTVDIENDSLKSSVVTPEPSGESPEPREDDEPLTEDEQAAADALANPAGSDLWLAEYIEEGALVQTISVPDDVSVLLASNGTDPAPDRVEVSWPLDNATPWAGPLIVGGILLLLIGLVLYLLGIQHMRKSRGPRRKGVTAGPGMEKMPKVPKPSRYKSDKQHGSAPKRKRSLRKSMIAIVPITLVSTLALTGCSASSWPDFSGPEQTTATPTPTDAVLPEDEQPPPAVSAPQLERIVSRISGVALEADAERDGTLAATRFTGPALDERTANYAIRGKIADYALPTPIPASAGGLTLPQATETWPRTVLTVVHDDTDEALAPTAVVLVQDNPRANYLVQSAVRLEPEAEIPDVAPATIGTAQLPPDSTFQILPPDQLAAAYADIVTKGEESEYFELFDVEGDTLLAGIAETRATKKKLPGTATIEFSTAAGTTDPVALATNESGAIVAVDIVETEVVKPVDTGAKIELEPDSATSALSGLTETEKGVQATYTDQLLFYVPPTGSSEKIRLLGFTQGLTKAAEL